MFDIIWLNNVTVKWDISIKCTHFKIICLIKKKIYFIKQIILPIWRHFATSYPSESNMNELYKFSRTQLHLSHSGLWTSNLKFSRLKFAGTKLREPDDGASLTESAI